MSENKENEKMSAIPKLVKEKSDVKSTDSDEKRSIRPPTLLSKIGRPCQQHSAPKAGPPPRDSTMSRDVVDNVNTSYTDMYQETVKRFTRSSLSPDEDRNSTKSSSNKSNRKLSFDLYVEATGRRQSHDQGIVLTSNTENFIIGQRIYVGGTRPGQIAYIGETHFAPGEWAGIVLDEPNGKNDGCVAGKRYFQCEAKKGIFSRLTRLTLEPIKEMASSSRTSPNRSRTVSPTASVRSSFQRSPGGKQAMAIGDRVIVSSGMGSRKGILRFLGETQFASGNWCGIELDEPSGKNDGTVDGVRYFECPPKYGIFVPIAKVSLSPSSKKPRMSRAGSRESLLSVGTLNSVATTNTSRLRMSAQKKTSPIKQVTTPTKSSFSLQDVIREKQNHIEQLMIERELSLEESQNQSLQFQKNINELKGRIADLEKRLGKEKKKTEDLQVSVDEATFCGDELNAQTQYYVEKIADLEAKLLQLSSGNGNSSTIKETLSDIVNAKLKESADSYESQIATLVGQEKSLQENLKYLSSQNESLQKELLSKDEHLEKLSNNVEELERLRQEISEVKRINQNEATQVSSGHVEQISNRDTEINRLSSELNEATSKLISIEKDKFEIENQLKAMKVEFLNRDKKIDESTLEINKLKTDLEKEIGNSKKLSDEIKLIEAKRSEQESNQMSSLEKKAIELIELKEELQQITTDRDAFDNRIKQLQIELTESKRLQLALEESVKGSSDEKANKISDLETHIQKLNNHITENNAQNEKLSTKIKSQIEERTKLQNDYQNSLKDCEHQKKLIDEKNAEIEGINNQLESLKTSSNNLQDSHSEYQTQKQLEIAALFSTNTELTEKLQQHESESLSAIESLKIKIAELLKVNNTFEESASNQISEINQLKEKLTQQEQNAASSLKDLSSKIESLENANQSMIETSTQKDSEISKLIASLQTEQEQSAKILQELNAKNNEFESLKSQLRQNSDTKNVEIENLREQLAMEKEESNRNLQELDLKLKEFETLRIKFEDDAKSRLNEIEKLKELIEQQKEINSSSENSLQSKVAELIDLNKSLEESNNEKNSELENLKTIVSEKEITLQQKITQLNEYVEKFESANKAYSDIKQEREQINLQHNELLDNFKTNESKLAKQELEFSDICRKHAALTVKCENISAQNESLQNDLGTLRSTSTDSNAEIIKLTEEIANKQKLYQENLDKSASDRIQLENQLQEVNQHLKVNQTELDSLKAELKNSNDQRSIDVQNFDKLKAEIIFKNEKELNELKTNFDLEKQKLKDHFENELKISEKTQRELNESIVKLQEQIKLLLEELQSSENSFKAKEAGLLAQIQSYSSEKESLQSTLEKIQMEGSSSEMLVQQEKSSLLSKIESLTQELLKKSNEIESLKQMIEKDRSDHEIVNIKLNERENAYKVLENDLDAFKLQFNTETSKTKDFKEKLDDSKQKLETSEKSNSELEKKISEMAATLESLVTAKSEMGSKLLENNQEADSLKSKLENSQKDNAELNLKILETETKFKELTETLENVQKAKISGELIVANYKDKVKTSENELQVAEKTNTDLLRNVSELMEALSALDKDKCEISSNFELFELESDKTVSELKEVKLKLENDCLLLKNDISEKDNKIISLQTNVNSLSKELEIIKSNLDNLSSNSVENSKLINDFNSKNVELTKSLTEKEVKIKQLTEKLEAIDLDMNKKVNEIFMLKEENLKMNNSLPTQDELRIQAEKDALIEEHNTACKESINEFEAMLEQQTATLTAVQNKLSSLEKEKSNYVDAEHSAVLKYNSLLKKMEVIEIEKLNEIAALKDKINDLQSITKIKDDKHIINDDENTEDAGSEAQINFLNSIIADMHKTNETLKARIEVLESGPTDYTKPLAFEVIGRRKPTPRMFCDICDEFDLHETEDCPLQSSDSPPPSIYQNEKERKLPAPRDYCESCEVFGHKLGECPDDECF